MSSPDSLSLALAVADALIEGGMRDAVICPGSRSAPLAYALADLERRGRIRLHVRIDERSAAFLAHGLALASGRPVGVVTTSGTAVGNLLPAVMEACHAGTRLVALTADRPAELHGTGANQTTVQDGVLASHTRFWATLPADPAPGRTAQEHLADAAALVTRALLAADGVDVAAPVAAAPSGPVHLNLAFRAPLVPEAGVAARMGARAPLAPAMDAAPATPARPATGALPDLSSPAARALADEDAAEHPWRPAGADLADLPGLDASHLGEGRTVVLAGHGAGPVAVAFALALGLPLLAEPSSGARFGVNAVAAYPLLLGAAGGLGPDAHPLAARIERVVLFGRPTLTRTVGALLARDDVETLLHAPEPAPWFEPGRRREHPVETLEELARRAGRGEPGWLAAWQDAAMRAQAALEDVLTAEDRRTGMSPQTVAHLTAAVTRGPLVLGSSSLIRDVDLLWRPPGWATAQVYANRGLAGIDGTIATAAGVALATRRRTVALLGDLTALHDAGGLLVGPTEADPDLDLVVVNDDGGAIFAGLEHGQVGAVPGMAATVERLFGTPHGADLAALARAHGAAHVLASDREGLVGALADPVRGRRVIEVRCDRADRPRVAAALTAAVRATFPDAAQEARR